MRKYLLLLLALLLALTGCAAAEDEEFSMEDILSNVKPEVVEKTIVQPTPEPQNAVEEEEASIYEPDGSILITLSAAGDLALSGDLYDAELTKQSGNIHFPLRNIRETLMQDDVTLINLESAASAEMLAQGSVEAVSLGNDGVLALDENAQQELKQALSLAGIAYAQNAEVGVKEIKGIQVAMLSYSCLEDFDRVVSRIPQDVAAAKTQYPIVVVSFHWGRENAYTPDEQQVLLGRLAVDSGADLVLGHRSRSIQPIEYYKGAYICYSLGSFCYTGEDKPSDMSSYIFQTRFRMRDGVVEADGFRILPIRISSRTDRNDFTPSLLDKATAVDSILNTLRENGSALQFAVEDYPLTW